MSDRGMLARWDHAKWLQDRLGEARAENARLRSVLKQALDCKGAYNGTVSQCGGDPALCAKCAAAVRAALGEADDDDLELSA